MKQIKDLKRKSKRKSKRKTKSKNKTLKKGLKENPINLKNNFYHYPSFSISSSPSKL